MRIDYAMKDFYPLEFAQVPPHLQTLFKTSHQISRGGVQQAREQAKNSWHTPLPFHRLLDLGEV